MAGRGRGRRSDAGQSSGSHPDGVYMSADQFLELFRSTQPPVHPRVSPPRKSAFARQCGDFAHLGGKPFKGSSQFLKSKLGFARASVSSLAWIFLTMIEFL